MEFLSIYVDPFLSLSVENELFAVAFAEVSARLFLSYWTVKYGSQRLLSGGRGLQHHLMIPVMRRSVLITPYSRVAPMRGKEHSMRRSVGEGVVDKFREKERPHLGLAGSAVERVEPVDFREYAEDEASVLCLVEDGRQLYVFCRAAPPGRG
jgi:hypothetical protein